jgi:tRNA nucleotidyltransferase (CCA-adding enzyme)
MEIYMVGGAVRDALLGLPVKDRDWVLVGAEPQDLLAQGYLPVGKDFPVFLHPQTREEYALARTERKTAPGYHGFAFHAAADVTLEQDLARRDLTVNAMAVAQHRLRADGSFPLDALQDPFGGHRDLQDRLLRHVTDAFREDPVRILRLARLAARFQDFAVAPETRALVCRMVDSGEAAALVAERVWQELARGLMEVRPSRMLQVLAECGALPVLLPELAQVLQEEAARIHAVLDIQAGTTQRTLAQQFALLCHALHDEAALRALCARLRVPVECRDMALLLQREGRLFPQAVQWDAAQIVDGMERCDAFRRPERYLALLEVARDIDAAAGHARRASALQQRLVYSAQAAWGVSTAEVARAAQAEGLSGPRIAGRIRERRMQAVASGLADAPPT